MSSSEVGLDPEAAKLGWARSDWLAIGVLLVLSLLPVLIAGTAVNADTKQWLLLDPTRLMERAPFLWDQYVNGGTVTHQNIGYLLPMGPFFSIFHSLGMPAWLIQRVWIGSILFGASFGAFTLFRRLWGRSPAILVGSIAYGFSLYPLGQVTGQSGLLLPFVAFPWLVLAAIKSIRSSSWSGPAVFALIVTVSSALNGSSIAFVIFGALLWIPFEVFVLRSRKPWDGIKTLGRIGLLLAVTQLWWVVAYWIGGKYGLPILELTESVRTTSQTASPLELLRGLGYWFFYGGDVYAPWLEGFAEPFMRTGLALIASFVPAFLAFAIASFVRFQQRIYFVGLICVGVLFGAVAYSYPPRSPVGTAFEAASRISPTVLSLRNTQRAVPLIVLGIAALLCVGIQSASSRLTSNWRMTISLGFIAVFALAISGPYLNGFIAPRFSRPANIPQEWRDAASYLNQGQGRVLLLPGQDFGSYRWGHTLDPVLPGLTDREVVWRELVPQGGATGSDLLAALDRQLQEGVLDPELIVPLCHWLGVSQIVVANDLEYERYRTVLPGEMMRTLSDPRAGVRLAATFGDGYVNVPDASRVFETESSLRNGQSTSMALPQIAIFDVPNPEVGRFAARSIGSEAIVLGDGLGMLSASASGLLNPSTGPLFSESQLVGWDAALATVDPLKVEQVVTDTNRLHESRYYSLRENNGATLQLTGEPRSGLTTDYLSTGQKSPLNRLTTTRLEGVASITANAYGNANTLNPEDRPSNAFDGDPKTSWRVDYEPFSVAGVEGPPTISLDLGRPVSSNQIVLLQPQGRVGTIPVRTYKVVLDGSRSFTVTTDPNNPFSEKGTSVVLDSQPFSRVDVSVLDPIDELKGPVGLAEITIPGVSPLVEWVSVPPPFGMVIGTPMPVGFLFQRWRASPTEPVRSDPEPALRRIFTVPANDSYSLRGTVRLDRRANDAAIDSVLGTLPRGTVATSSERLFGYPAARASSALDDDPATSWTTPFTGVVGQSWSLKLDHSISLDSIEIATADLPNRSLITSVEVKTDNFSKSFGLDGNGPIDAFGNRTYRLDLGRSVTAQDLQIVITGITPRTSKDLYSKSESILPASIAEIRFQGAPRASISNSVAPQCRDDLVAVDGIPIPILVKGDVGSLGDLPLQFVGCGSNPFTLSAGEHRIVAVNQPSSALQVDQTILSSALLNSVQGQVSASQLEVSAATNDSAQIDTNGSAFWLQYNQSSNAGWEAAIKENGKTESLGNAHPMGPFANGWLVSAGSSGSIEATVQWAPQRWVTASLIISIIGLLGCILIVFISRRLKSQTIEVGYRVSSAPFPSISSLKINARSFAWAIAAVAPVALLLGGVAVMAGVLLFGIIGVVVASKFSRGSIAVHFVPSILLGLAIAIVIATVKITHPSVNILWPSKFEVANILSLVSLFLLLALILADRSEPDSK